LAATAPLAVEMLAADDPSSLADTVSWAQLVARAVQSRGKRYPPSVMDDTPDLANAWMQRVRR
jgi:3-deoxy-D-arabino-heptulosonate 7-phosphate (DAHP) synthase